MDLKLGFFPEEFRPNQLWIANPLQGAAQEIYLKHYGIRYERAVLRTTIKHAVLEIHDYVAPQILVMLGRMALDLERAIRAGTIGEPSDHIRTVLNAWLDLYKKKKLDVYEADFLMKAYTDTTFKLDEKKLKGKLKKQFDLMNSYKNSPFKLEVKGLKGKVGRGIKK